MGHDADVFAVAPGGDGLDPGDAFAVPEHFHAVDGFDDGGIVAQQDVAEPVGVVSGQLELSGDVEVSGVGLIHIRFLRFRFRKTGKALAVPDEGKTRRQILEWLLDHRQLTCAKLGWYRGLGKLALPLLLPRFHSPWKHHMFVKWMGSSTVWSNHSLFVFADSCLKLIKEPKIC